MSEKKHNKTAPCGLYCGACMIYRANKRGESDLIEQLKAGITQQLDEMEAGRMPGMPPRAEGFDFSQIKKEVQEGKEFMSCEGCLSKVVALPCRICGIRACAQERGVTHCSKCPEMPCQWLIDFKNDGIPHHADIIVNLERQREIGLDRWLDEQTAKWRCAQCGSPLAWYDAECPDCHATQTKTYGSSPFSTE